MRKKRDFIGSEIVMEKSKWYFKNGTRYEMYSVLYKNDGWILVQNDNTEEYSFGLVRDFGTLLGFPVDQSCLTLKETERILISFINIDKQYLDKLGAIAENNIQRWNDMLLAIGAETINS